MSANDSRFIWVTPTETAYEDGSNENPFGSISKAVEYAQPGQTVVLKGGNYSGDVTIQNSGTIDKPIRIIAEEGADACCIASCWFFYDVSDVICSGITFKESPNIALSVIGECKRNRFEYLQFVNCSNKNDGACTMFFGGSGQACNTVESCRFEHTPESIAVRGPRRGEAVGLMIAEGDVREGEPNKNHIIGKNVFSGYPHGIIIGSGDAPSGEYGHLIAHNTFDNCAFEAMLVKCGDTLVKGNIIRNCGRHSISVLSGSGSVIEDNRILDCGYGIRVAGKGHSIINNCIVRCREDALGVLSSRAPGTEGASNIIIERNTIIDWGCAGGDKHCAVRIGPMTTCIVKGNLFSGAGAPYILPDAPKENSGEPDAKTSFFEKNCLITDNIVSGACAPLNGCSLSDVKFQSPAFDNYINDSGYGAEGWMLTPEAYEPERESPSACLSDENVTPERDAEEEVRDSETDADAVEASIQSLFPSDDESAARLSMIDRGFFPDELDEQET